MKQAWIKSATFDSIWILAPGLIPVLLLFIFPSIFIEQSSEISPFYWVVLILLIDVAHVHSSLYRTYFNPLARKKFSTLFKAVPFISWLVGVLLYSISSIVFWRCLAYLAVFHFIRQQYGFLKIYSRNETLSGWVTKIQTTTIYAVTFIPICIWHVTGPKNFNWFVEGDFFYLDSPTLGLVLKVIFFLVIITYFVSELYVLIKCKTYNIPRLFLVVGTAASWYIGIVLFNGDLSFTALNVISHGIPYMALVWVSEKKQASTGNSKFLKLIFSYYGVLLFVGLVVLFAYIEEGLWDALVWREREGVFHYFYFLKPLKNIRLFSLVVPFLALPQIVHYVLDG
ncbi:MAG TPA: hypothetical protein VN698_08305, partial [Bacteroidia bacterium]|nr:hypothetical protein [Bacteroidia bacterium]